MKKIIVLTTSALLFLSACGDKKSEESQVKEGKEGTKSEKVTTEKPTEEKATNEKPTTEAPTTEAPKSDASGVTSYISKDGRIDMKSPEFVKDYFYSDHINEFGGVKIGMPIEEVEELYGKSIGHGVAAQHPTTGRFGDFALDYTDGTVQTILLNPHEVITADEALALYGEPTEKIEERNNTFIYNSNKENNFKVIVGFDYNWNLQYMQHVKDESKSTGKSATSEFPEETKTLMVDEFLSWADERAKIGNMAVSDKYFNHGAAGFGDWYAITPDGQVQTQDNNNPGFDGFDIHAIGGVVFYTPVSGDYGATDELDATTTAQGYHGFSKKGTNIHKYMLADNGVVYELIQKAEDMTLTTGFGERDNDGSDGIYKPTVEFVVSGDDAAQTEWQRILKQYK